MLNGHLLTSDFDLNMSVFLSYFLSKYRVLSHVRTRFKLRTLVRHQLGDLNKRLSEKHAQQTWHYESTEPAVNNPYLQTSSQRAALPWLASLAVPIS